MTANLRTLRAGLLNLSLVVLFATPAAAGGVDRYGDGIVVMGSDEFRATMEAALYALFETPTGEQIYERLDASGKVATITEMLEANAYAIPQEVGSTRNADGTPGAGSDTNVKINPNFEPIPLPLILGHELIHALHFALGEALTGDGTIPGIPAEEQLTTGTGLYEDEALTENALRTEFNAIDSQQYLAQRTTYAELPGAQARRGDPRLFDTRSRDAEPSGSTEEPGATVYQGAADRLNDLLGGSE
jgi:hypothetical protein